MMQGAWRGDVIIQTVVIFPLPVFERHVYDPTETTCHLIFSTHDQNSLCHNTEELLRTLVIH